jgi:hypothetical protein
MRREFKCVLFFSGACLAAGARAEADPQLTAMIAEQLQKVQSGLEAPASTPAMATVPEGALEAAGEASGAEASASSAEASVPSDATTAAPAEGAPLVVKDAEGLDLRWPWQRHAAPDAPLPDGVVTAPGAAPVAPAEVVVDSGEQWYLRNIWVRLRARGGFRVPGIVSVRAVPEIEMEWQRAFPKGWKQFEPTARR